ncbi:MAG: hypothetical protein ACE5I5_17580 [Candidatus Heimdallarchaeota archaeon]
MSSVVTLQDQIRELMRGPRILGEFMDNPTPTFDEREQIIRPVEQSYEKPSETFVFKKTSIESWEFVPLQDPFSLSLREFLSLGLDETKDILTRVYDLCKDLLEEAWKRGIRQAVICNGDIVFESTDIEDIPNETIEQIAKKYNKACYVFSAPDEVEESPWTPIYGDDFYPTLSVYLGVEDTDESEIVKSSPIHADFDTGNPAYKIFDANQLAEPLTIFTPLQMRQGSHLGRAYTYFPKKVKMCVRDSKGNIGSFVCDVRLVRDWAGCALLQTSPNRVGFIGRDVLRDLRIRLELDPLKKTTRIVDVSS